ncbi:MAG: DUF4214 domain-containing protein [Leptolyngbya sp. SIO1D8]|nr:DUF4214 domain-containing protein [Leptolyngbya sp. SIO1D8]
MPGKLIQKVANFLKKENIPTTPTGMDNQEFIDFWYQKVLKRKPETDVNKYYKKALESGEVTREEIIIRLINSEEFRPLRVNKEFVPPGHFYSAIPSQKEREAFLAEDLSGIDEIPGVNLNIQKQVDLLNQFKQYYEECPFPDNKTEQFRYYYLNPAYSYGDALTLYGMMRHFKPKRIIEMGSGFSSCAMLDTNDHFFGGEIEFTFVEPYPELLYSLIQAGDEKNVILPQGVQAVDKGIFDGLEANDILFVDSTHVSKLNSDVNRIIFEILASLRKGVVIHFHDIFWPFEYPKSWIREGRAWNEAYILRAFLEFNESFEILFFADYLNQFQHDWFQKNMPLYLKNSGGNIWMQKVK